MKISLFLNFDGCCRQALDFYETVFETKTEGLGLFSDMPPHPDHPLKEEDKNKVMFASQNICGTDFMFSDIPEGMDFQAGSQISPVVVGSDKDRLRVFFDRLKEGGHVVMELGPTFWSEQYGMVTDRFGITWQLSYAGEKSLYEKELLGAKE